ncbi:hypothetical protein [Roseovarius aestuarii]|uniref:Uncharacterized protein n=1 Tax=Roseovarius aestuarii TaxID=475083 RepID=A0A1X7BVL2_9RHOB|nr:hypothetical protein [Roseovarius aestuarii]SMC13702.1 hypothetical protein ROA7745_03559 [Roseovarius aestuarii]
MDKKAPAKKPKKAVESREDRLKQALKANLARRKAQSRARDAADTGTSEGKE